MRPVGTTVAIGLALMATAVGLTLTRSPLTLAGKSPTPYRTKFASNYGGVRICQANEVLPGGASAIRLALHSPIAGPSVTVEALSGTHVITQGERAAGWTAGVVTVPVRLVSRTVFPVKICFAIDRSPWLVAMRGRLTPPSVAANDEGRALGGRVAIEYLRPGHVSWWSRALSVTRQMGLGHAGSGAWIALLALALTSTVAALTAWLIIRELR
jgi:hypothetical protein